MGQVLSYALPPEARNAAYSVTMVEGNRICVERYGRPLSKAEADRIWSRVQSNMGDRVADNLLKLVGMVGGAATGNAPAVIGVLVSFAVQGRDDAWLREALHHI